MKTSAIIVRVADFLKLYPPFSSLESEALLRIARSGRVRYHEKDEILYEEGGERDGRIYVINKGAVRLTRQFEGNEQVLDLRGVGDLLGVGGYIGEATYESTAKTNEDSIIYALDMETFTRECALNPQASRFLALFFAAAEVETGDEAFVETGRHTQVIDWFASTNPDWVRQRAKLITGPGDQPVREAAATMAANDSGAFVVVDDAHRPLGIITEVDLRNRVATGEIPLDAPVTQLMHSPVVTAKADISVGRALLAMMRHNCRHLVITPDGSLDRPASGLISERELMLFYGNNPLTLIREIHRTRDFTMLGRLRHRVEALLLSGLRSSSDVPWYMGVMAATVQALGQRLQTLCLQQLPPPPGDFEIVLTGSLGRRESLTRTDFTTILLYDDEAETGRDWFVEFFRRMTAAACQIGFDPPRHALFKDTAECCRSISDWHRFYRDLIDDPIGGEIWRRLTLFDLSNINAVPALLPDLQSRIRKDLDNHPNFVRLLANDSLQNIPPLTIFEGYAVNAAGLQLESLDVKKDALQPMIDVARVYHLESGDLTHVNTLDRLGTVASCRPEQRGIFQAAQRAFRIVTYFRAITGLSAGNDGMTLHPAALSRTDQVMLKRAFHSIAELLRVTSGHYKLQL